MRSNIICNALSNNKLKIWLYSLSILTGLFVAFKPILIVFAIFSVWNATLNPFKNKPFIMSLFFVSILFGIAASLHDIGYPNIITNFFDISFISTIKSLNKMHILMIAM